MGLTNSLFSAILALLTALFFFIHHRFKRGERKFDIIDLRLNKTNSKVDNKVEKNYCEEKRDKFQEDFVKCNNDVSNKLTELATNQKHILSELKEINGKKGD